MIVGKQFGNLARRRNKAVYNVLLRPSASENGEEIQSHDVTKLLSKCKDGFERLQELQPKRDTELKIDLETDIKPVMGPMYKLSV